MASFASVCMPMEEMASIRHIQKWPILEHGRYYHIWKEIATCGNILGGGFVSSMNLLFAPSNFNFSTEPAWSVVLGDVTAYISIESNSANICWHSAMLANGM